LTGFNVEVGGYVSDGEASDAASDEGVCGDSDKDADDEDHEDEWSNSGRSVASTEMKDENSAVALEEA
jgi:hypothetical protein